MLGKFLLSQKGQSLIELLITIGLMAVLLPALLVGFIATRSGRAQQEQRLKATALMREGEEAVRVVRETDWTTFAALSSPANTAYKLAHDAATGKTWILTGGTETANGLTRTIYVNDVYRDFTTDPTNAPIVASTDPNATLDPSTKQVVVTVHWDNPLSTTESATEYLTRDESLKYTETTKAQFDNGVSTANGTKTQLTSPSAIDGEVILAAGGAGLADWCAPSLNVASVDLSRQGVPTAISAYSLNNVNSVVTGTGGNASGPTFVKTTISGDPPTAGTIQFNGQYNNSKANGVFTEGHFGYIATTNGSQEIQILDLNSASGNPLTFSSPIGSFNSPGTGEGDSIFVSGNTGYMTYFDNSHGGTRQLYTFSIAANRTSTSILNASHVPSLAGKGTKIIVVGNYAYIAENSSSTQLEVYDISDLTNPKKAGFAQITNGQQGVDIFVSSDGKRVYLVTTYASGKNDVFILDSSSKSTTTPVNFPILGQTNTNGMTPTGITIVAAETRAIVVGIGGSLQYQVFDITTKAAPTTCTNPSTGLPAGLAIASGANAVASVTEDNTDTYSYVLTGDTHAELKIIQGGGGGAGNTFATSGTFVSQTVDLGALAGTNKDVALNNFTASYVLNGEPNLQFYIGLVHGPCAGATFTSYSGPYTLANSGDIQALTLSSSGGYRNPGQCLQYKVQFTSDGTHTPVFQDITFSFSP